jgi:hypothetical protein
MNYLRESFPTLENASTQAGEALAARQEGQVAASQNGAIGFSFKDVDGNVILPQLNSRGQVPVTSDISGDNLYARGSNAAGSATVVTIATIALVTSKKYQGIELVANCHRDAVFQVVHNDNGSETILVDAFCGPGSLSVNVNLEKIEFTAGASGTQQLLVKAFNINALSTLSATVATLQLV